ncbi:vacuolar protein sorting-associated protein 13b [Plakobranchus ocellatus]|uniref:Vacuolar protein sorting-associated protein 13b n=1 Tax=Plakobranchus ocellatus TaxID=259542 RepID=A0AAV4DQ63_9GAST|nr:vacuolar protein sorting-associated protein 13b [Plakobranchus ocellatus]
MFKLESYITPLLMGYLDKYVKLRHEDFQLSLWGGDAVLNNLDLRLDELEKVVQLPVMFQSGHIHELRLHVPWTKLGSEPVVITINTVECIVKVRDTAYETGSSGKSASSPGKSSQQRQRSRRRAQPTEDLPPGYLQSIVNRIVNNVTFIMNNLILKFVEDDIVLSVNIKSAECYSVDKEWNRAFVELTPIDLALRKIINFADLTVCLDKTNASGHIESYQEPMAYRCAVTCRFHMEYDSVTAKFPRASRFNLYCDTLLLTLTDTQLPMFVRLVQLCIAMYYGLLDIPAPPTPQSSSVDPISLTEGEELVKSSEPAVGDDPEDQGWASWAWSYVPQLLPTEEEEEEQMRQEIEEGIRREKAAPHILSLGFYIHKGTVLFKLTEKSRDSSELPHKKMSFHPFLKLDVEGVGIEILLQGLEFFSVGCGITAFRLSTCGECICGIDDEKVDRCNTLLSGGESLDQKIGLDYLSNSLFDDMSWENRGQRSEHIVDGDQHRQVFTEQYALQRFGAFWLDQLYTMDKPEGLWAGSNSSEANSSDAVFLKEYSTLRFLFGHTHLQFTSTFYHRISKLLACASNHQYQPYGSGKSDPQSSMEERPKPSEEQVQSLEEFIPTNIMHFMLFNPTLTIVTAEHAYCDVAKKNFKTREKKKRESSSKSGSQQQQSSSISSSSHASSSAASSLPALVLTASRFDLQITRPMYPGRLVKMVTSIAGPSSNLLHHCHSHTQIKLFSLQGGLQRCELDGSVSHTLTLLPPCSFALYSRSLQLPKLWANSSLSLNEWMYEVPNTSVNVSKASVLMASRVVASWLSPSSPSSFYAGKSQAADQYHHQQMSSDSLLDDLFPTSGESTHQTFPMLEVGLCGMEFKSCRSKLVSAYSGGLSSLHVLLYTPGIGGKMSAIPILYGPNDTSSICDSNYFTKPSLEPSNIRADCITATVQIPKESGISEAQALTLVDCQGLCVWLDPSLVSWFHYCPQPRPGRSTSDQPSVTLDLSLAQMTSPLNAVSQASVHSTSSPSHQGVQSRRQLSTSHSRPPRSAGGAPGAEAGGSKADGSTSLGQSLAEWFPFIRLLHLQVDLKPSAIFLPKTSVPACESSPDILTLVHQARQQGRLSDTLVICLPSLTVSSTMTKPLSVVQDLPVTSIHGSLIGEKLPWTVKIKNMCAYSLLSGLAEPSPLLHPMDIVSTVAVTCKYNPPTSEVISSMALCLHVDVGPPQVDLRAAQLQLCSTAAAMANSICGNTLDLMAECSKLFAHSSASKGGGGKDRKPSESANLVQSQTFAPVSHKRSMASTGKMGSAQSVGEVTETNPTTDISEDFSHEGSPLHESLIDEADDPSTGVKLSLWLQLMVPSLTASVYTNSPVREQGLSLTLDHLDISLDSQHVYTKVKLNLGSIGVQHSAKSMSGQWSWTDPSGIVVSCRRQLPRHLSTVTTRLWRMDSHTGHHGPPFPQHHMGAVTAGLTSIAAGSGSGGSKKNSSCAVSVTFTRALCKNVKRRLRKANVELPVVSELDPLDTTNFPDIGGEPAVRDSETEAAGGSELKKENLELYFHQYLSEICVKTEPLDFVLRPELVSLLSNLSASLTSSQHEQSDATVNFLASPGFDRNFGKATAKKSVHSEQKVSSTFVNMPLIYADLGVIRVFLPQSKDVGRDAAQGESSAGDLQDLSHSTVISIEDDPQPPDGLNTATTGIKEESPQSEPGSEVCSTLNHTMMVMQINSCVVQPHADNPLQRTALEKDLYQRAVQAGMNQQPGSVLEDRQYQLNMRGIAFSTGIWEHLVLQAEEAERQKSPMASQVQIPALDWNTILMDSAGHERKEVKLIPLASSFDVCVVVAPPITYISQAIPAAPILVCGLTSEMNVTSDLDLYLSANQVKLLAEIANQFGRAARVPITSGLKSQQTTKVYGSTKGHHLASKAESRDKVFEDAGYKDIGRQRHVDHGGVGGRGGGVAGAGVDSGVESDLSALTLDPRRVTALASEAQAPRRPSTNNIDSKNAGQNDLFRSAVNHERDPKREEDFGVSHKRTPGNTDGADVNQAAPAQNKGELFASSQPIDILLTAGRISCTVYSHKILEEDFTLQMPLFGDHHRSPSPPAAANTQSPGRSSTLGSVKDNLTLLLSKKITHPKQEDDDDDDDDEGFNRDDNEDESVEEVMLDGGFTSFNFMKPHPEDNSVKKVISAGSVSVIPFVYLYITQPHCIVSNHQHSSSSNYQHHGQHVGGDAATLKAVSERQGERRLEVSCYDVLIKGASDKHISAVDEYHVIPVCADFNVHWLETRPGEPDAHTGIPPSLLTASLVQKAHMPGVVRLSLERPMRLKASHVAVEQICLFVDDLVSGLTHKPPRPGGKLEEDPVPETQSTRNTKGGSYDFLILAERLEVTTSQLVVDLDLDTPTSDDDDLLDNRPFPVGVVLSTEGIGVQVEILDALSEQHICVRGLLQLKDTSAKTCFNKQRCRPLIGPFSVDVDASLTWITLSPDLYIPQVAVAVDSSIVRATFGQEHLFCITNLVSQLNLLAQKIFKSDRDPSQSLSGASKKREDKKSTESSAQKSEDRGMPYAIDFTQDDLRSGSFQFIDSQDGSCFQPEAYEVLFSPGDSSRGEGSSMTWCYPHPRVLTGVILNPVPFSLSATEEESSSTKIPCELQYWSELTSQFVGLIKIHVSENEPVKVSLPDPTRPGSRADLISARLWRVVLGTSSASAPILPASLAACMCVNSALVPSLVPTVLLSLRLPAVEVLACHHLQYNGQTVPEKLSLYQVCPEAVDDQAFAVVRVKDISGSLVHLAGPSQRSSVKLSGEASMSVIEYGHLTMEEILSPTCLTLTADVDAANKSQNVDACLGSNKMKVKVGRSVVHSLHMAAAAWTTFNPVCSGPHLVFNHLIICNNTASSIRFGQAGTNENIVLNSREMCGYSWASESCSELLHVCMDSPSWKWTEPFPVRAVSGGSAASNRTSNAIVRSVVAQDQSWVIIVRVKHLSGLQTQVTICGQMLVSNRLSQPISMRLCSSRQDDKTGSGIIGKTILPGNGMPHHRVFTVQPGAYLPSLVENEVMASPVQFRLAGYHTSYSHDIFLSGDKMKDNQMIKIPLPDKSSYFHVWCRIFCQHFHGMPQKLGSPSTVTLRMVMLTPLYVVRTHLPRPLHIHLDSPKVQSSQDIQVGSQGREFQLHCLGGDITHLMSFRLGASMQLSSPPVVLSTGLIEQLERSGQAAQADVEQLCDLQVDTARLSWPYLGDEARPMDLDAGDSNPYSLSSQVSHHPSSSSGQTYGGLKPVLGDSDLELDLEPQPSVDLQVRLSEYIPGCDTLLVEVAPSCLVHNGTDMDLVLGSEDDDGNLRWTVRPGQTMAPPSPKANLRLAVKFQSMISEEKAIPVSSESSDYRRYNDDLGRVLFVDSFVHASFQFSYTSQEKAEVAFLTVTSDLQHGIRIICIRERFALCNRTGLDLETKLLALPLSLNPIQMSATEGTRVICPTGKTSLKGVNQPKGGHKNVDQAKQDCVPLFRWRMVDRRGEGPSQRLEGQAEEQTYVCYIAFSKENTSEYDHRVKATQDWLWSVPVRLVSSKDSRRTTTSVPDFCRLSSDPENDPGQISAGSQRAEHTGGSTSLGTIHQPELHAGQSLCLASPGDESSKPAAAAQAQVSDVPISQAVCVTSQQVKGVTHLVLSPDLAPVFVIENLCSFALQYGQACELLGINGAVIQEQVELVSDLPWVPARGWCHYTPPTTNSEFVNRERVAIPKLFFRACCIQDLSSFTSAEISGTTEWSSPIQTVGNTDAFIQLRGFCDLKVAIETVGMVTHLVIRPVSKAEVTAREIRSRLKGSGSDHILVEGTSGGDELSGKFGSSVVKWQRHLPDQDAVESDCSGSDLPPASSSASDSSFTSLSRASAALAKAIRSAPSTFSSSAESFGGGGGKMRRRRTSSTSSSAAAAAAAICPRFRDLYNRSRKYGKKQQGMKLSLSVGVFCEMFSLEILDESLVDKRLSPLMAIYLRDMFFASFPVAKGPDAACAKISFSLSVGSIQVDNQRFGVGTYDFPVVFLPQAFSSSETEDSASSSVARLSFLTEAKSVVELHAIMKSRAFCHIQAVVYEDSIWRQSGVESVDVFFKPFSVYVDDTFVYRVLEEVEAFAPSRLTSSRLLINSTFRQTEACALSRKLPLAVELNSLVLSMPVRIKHLSIQPIKMLLSVHASVRLFLASDHTPLSLAKFERDQILSSTQRLVHALTVHYASAAIFRAGIVVGSLEILGNPTGLVRSIGTGVSDLISLPYSGLTRGPSAFVSGLSRGVGSLVRNISAGTITSVTNLASSISRNMDRLSLDAGHRQRQEESRRHRPAGLADGLRQGLTGFGISLLGAVAGLADHPMQTLLGAEGGGGGGGGVLEERRGSSPSSTASGLVAGVGKGLVGVLTKPIGGAAEFVSQTGQGLLHGTGLGQMPSRLELPQTWTRLEVPDSIFKCVRRALPSLPSPCVLLSVSAVTFDLAGQEVPVKLLLTPDVLVVVGLEEAEKQEDFKDGSQGALHPHLQQQQQQPFQSDHHQVFALTELECGRAGAERGVEAGGDPRSKAEQDSAVLVVCWQDQMFTTCQSMEDGRSSSKDRVAAFLDTQTEQVAPHVTFTDLQSEPVEPPALDQSETPKECNTCSQRQESHGKSTVAEKKPPSGADDNPQYEFVMDVDQRELFLASFRLAKNKLQGRGFPV